MKQRENEQKRAGRCSENRRRENRRSSLWSDFSGDKFVRAPPCRSRKKKEVPARYACLPCEGTRVSPAHTHSARGHLLTVEPPTESPFTRPLGKSELRRRIAFSHPSLAPSSSPAPHPHTYVDNARTKCNHLGLVATPPGAADPSS